jgi:hypothetical protein
MKRMVTGDFKVRSLESIGTLDQDLDVGVIRVSAVFLRKLGSRNSLVRVSIVRDGRKDKSLTRIVRAATGTRALRKDEIALQYDDRLALGIKKVGTLHALSIKPVNEWLALPAFLLSHPSPLVKREAVFALTLSVLGAVIGLVVGIAL